MPAAPLTISDRLIPTSQQCWPTGGEIDIFEMNGDPVQDLIWGSYHWAKPLACGKDLEPIPGRGTKPAGAAADWQTEWHLYAVEWSADSLDFYLDGHLYLSRKASHVDLPSSAMYLIFDQAVDQDLFPPSPTDPHYDGKVGKAERRTIKQDSAQGPHKAKLQKQKKKKKSPKISQDAAFSFYNQY